MERVVQRLEPPYEIFDLKSEEDLARIRREALLSPEEIKRLLGPTVRLRVERWEQGLMTIHPRFPGAPPTKEVEALRLHVPPEIKPSFPHYWDVTAGRLKAQFLPILRAPGFEKLEITVTKVGAAPLAYFEVSVKPLGRPG